MRTISWSEADGQIHLLDQTRLPLETVELVIDDHHQLIDAIKRLAIRGAPALGVAGAFGVALIAKNAERDSWSAASIDKAVDELRTARPTAVNLAWGVDQVRPLLKDGAAAVLQRALEMAAEDGRANHAMGSLGADHLIELLAKSGKSGNFTILTHCNTGALATTEWGTALGMIQELNDRGKLREVFADETRPLLQGARLTAWELAQIGIPYRILPDGAAASALFAGLIDAVAIGADRIARNGDSANKIGSLAVAVAAHAVGVPFFVVAPESTVDRSLADGSQIEIEFRDDREVTEFAGVPTAPKGSRTYNPAFDVTPARYITAVVTEKKVYRVSEGERL